MKQTIVGQISIALLLWTCQDASEKHLKPDVLNPNFNVNVGKEITINNAEQWINNFNKLKNGGREDNKEYAVKPAQLSELLKLSSIGIVFHYGLDEQGNRHIIIIPIDERLQLWTAPSRLIIDANSNSVITQDQAQLWIGKYQTVNPDKIRFHFFGSNIFKEILAIQTFNLLEIKQAINDQNIPQLLLLAWSNRESSNGRLMGDDVTVYDASGACPNHCLPPN